MNWLALVLFLEVGILPTGTVALYSVPPRVYEVDRELYSCLSAEISAYGTVFVGGSVRTGMWWQRGEWIWPHMADYLVWAGLRFGPLEVGWRHRCVHPVIPAYTRPDLPTERFYEEAYIRFTAER